MYKFENLDIIKALNKIVERNTAFYRDDFKADRKLIRKMPVGTTFIWLSRSCGTNIYTEDRAFLRDSVAYTSILYYSDQIEDSIQTYVVEIKSKDGNRIFGDLYTICPDYNLQEYAEHIRKSASEVRSYTLVYKKGSVTVSEIQRGYLDNDPEPGRLVDVVYNPKDKELHEMTLAQEKKTRKEADIGDFEEHISALEEQLSMYEANRIVEEAYKLPAPNSEDGEYFQVDISVAYVQIITRRKRSLFGELYKYMPFSIGVTKDLCYENKAYVSIHKDEILER